MERISSYPKVYNLGHPALRKWIEAVKPMSSQLEVFIQEKYDGSQFSFSKQDDDTVVYRSKRKQLYPETADKLFKKTIESIEATKPFLNEGWVYRGEAFYSNKHNTKQYKRAPKGNLVLFDIEMPDQTMAHPSVIVSEAYRLDLECAKVLHRGNWPRVDFQDVLLEMESSLGGTRIEGFVIKPLGTDNTFYDISGKVLLAKYVSEEFKEEHRGKHTVKNSSDPVFDLGRAYGTEARWNKQIQALKEDGLWTSSPKDIGPLLKRVNDDIENECQEPIKDKLYNMYRKKILKGATYKLPQWYKDKLRKDQDGSVS